MTTSSTWIWASTKRISGQDSICRSPAQHVRIAEDGNGRCFERVPGSDGLCTERGVCASLLQAS
eukprot:3828360-Rhodomonas_salina.1